MITRCIILMLLLVPVWGVSCAGLRQMPSHAVALEREGSFVAFSDGTVFDTTNRLMWSSTDFQRNVNRLEAESFCASFAVGGYDNWRLPSLDELRTLYDPRKTDSGGYRTTGLIRISGNVWASDLRILIITILDNPTPFDGRPLAGYLDFKTGKNDFADARQILSGFRILPVRNLD